jgi:hypothetical protein
MDRQGYCIYVTGSNTQTVSTGFNHSTRSIGNARGLAQLGEQQTEMVCGIWFHSEGPAFNPRCPHDTKVWQVFSMSYYAEID